jgi:hypothetical protein
MDRIMLVTQAVNALGYFIIAPFSAGENVVFEVLTNVHYMYSII